MERMKKRSMRIVKNSQHKAATKIQARWRGKLARKEVSEKKKKFNEAAEKI